MLGCTLQEPTQVPAPVPRGNRKVWELDEAAPGVHSHSRRTPGERRGRPPSTIPGPGFLRISMLLESDPATSHHLEPSCRLHHLPGEALPPGGDPKHLSRSTGSQGGSRCPKGLGAATNSWARAPCGAWSGTRREAAKGPATPLGPAGQGVPSSHPRECPALPRSLPDSCPGHFRSPLITVLWPLDGKGVIEGGHASDRHRKREVP